MFDPKKRLGSDDEDGGARKPMVKIAFGFKPGRRLGEDDEEGESEGAEPEGDLEAQADQAAERICRIININSSKAAELKSLITTICIAADAKPHSEGEHTDEEN